MFREASKFSQFDKVYTLRGQCPTSKEESKLSIMLMLIALKMSNLRSCLMKKKIDDVQDIGDDDDVGGGGDDSDRLFGHPPKSRRAGERQIAGAPLS